MKKYNTATLSNGLRIIHLPSPSPVVYCGIGVAAGSRHEMAGEEGVAHFVEHMSFKGTRRRSAIQILNCLESVGGDLNAFTNKEDTMFYAAIQKEHFLRAVDLLTDIVFCSQYPQHEVEHEVDVICDEIESYNDTPAELIYDVFENQLFKGHPLGHNILGTREQVQCFTSQHALRFTQRYYRPDNAIFFAYGDVNFTQLVKRLESRREEGGTMNEISPDLDISPASLLPPSSNKQEHHQAHVMLGCQSFSYNDSRRMSLFLLNNILGGPGMNARLNLKLREQHGLVYTVESSMASYSDTGVWSVYFGCDHHDVKRCIRLVRRELDRMMQAPLTERQFVAAKRQLKGQLTIAADNREQFALDMAKHFLHYGKERSLEEMIEQIDAITAPQLQDVAQQLFAPEHMQQLIL
jgi:predicted Zn-dependent peptidase